MRERGDAALARQVVADEGDLSDLGIPRHGSIQQAQIRTAGRKPGEADGPGCVSLHMRSPGTGHLWTPPRDGREFSATDGIEFMARAMGVSSWRRERSFPRGRCVQ